jgi:hypothetical protein
MLAPCDNALAAECPFAGQQKMLVVQLFFGQDIEGNAPVSVKEWRAFLRDVVTPRFPDGLTVYDGRGQWMNPKTRAIAREKTKIVEIAAPDSPDFRARIADLTTRYRDRFHQQSVGIVTTFGCAGF